jgi:hypothetical protein
VAVARRFDWHLIVREKAIDDYRPGHRGVVPEPVRCSGLREDGDRVCVGFATKSIRRAWECEVAEKRAPDLYLG